MGCANQINHSLKKLILMSGYSQRQIAKQTDIPYSTINDIVRGSKNKKLTNYFKLLAYFGLDIDSKIRQHLQYLNSSNPPSTEKKQTSDDIYHLIQELDPRHRKELLSTAINLHKLKKNSKLQDVLDRIEKQFIRGG